MNTNLPIKMESNTDTRTSRLNWRICFPIFLLVLAGVALTGCEALKVPLANEPAAPRAPKYPPDYATPDANFVAASFSKLASEFVDEYANQYVVFDCHYLTHRQGAFVMSGGRPLLYKNMMSAQLMNDQKGPV